jgi:hypothetical protein
MKNHREILETVIAKGGLHGICAKHYINDEEHAIQYIIELSEQCHADSLQKSWGGSLITDIVTFSRHHQTLNSNRTYE